MFKYFIICLLTASILSLNSTLPDLIKRTYKGAASSIINVTVGEHFSLPLPHFDSQWNSEYFHIYHISEE
jgi:hypothetical protein